MTNPTSRSSSRWLSAMRASPSRPAATGRGALTAVTQFSPALVILDVMLPDIDGIEVLRRLNSSGSKVPIISSPPKTRLRTRCTA